LLQEIVTRILSREIVELTDFPAKSSSRPKARFSA
jgi:hypothetical protein